MNITRKIEDYAEIINIPRPEPKFHRRMPMIKRAAQFAPFAALSGHHEAIADTARRNEESY